MFYWVNLQNKNSQSIFRNNRINNLSNIYLNCLFILKIKTIFKSAKIFEFWFTLSWENLAIFKLVILDLKYRSKNRPTNIQLLHHRIVILWKFNALKTFFPITSVVFLEILLMLIKQFLEISIFSIELFLSRVTRFEKK